MDKWQYKIKRIDGYGKKVEDIEKEINELGELGYELFSVYTLFISQENMNNNPASSTSAVIHYVFKKKR